MTNRPQANDQVVELKDLLPGDTVIARYKDWPGSVAFNGIPMYDSWSEEFKVTLVKGEEIHTTRGLILWPGTPVWIRSRGGAAPIVATPVTSAAQPKKDSLWNDTCPRCGRGTYSGAWKFEHEGGACQ